MSVTCVTCRHPIYLCSSTNVRAAEIYLSNWFPETWRAMYGRRPARVLQVSSEEFRGNRNCWNNTERSLCVLGKENSQMGFPYERNKNMIIKHICLLEHALFGVLWKRQYRKIFMFLYLRVYMRLHRCGNLSSYTISLETLALLLYFPGCWMYVDSLWSEIHL